MYIPQDAMLVAFCLLQHFIDETLKYPKLRNLGEKDFNQSKTVVTKMRLDKLRSNDVIVEY